MNEIKAQAAATQVRWRPLLVLCLGALLVLGWIWLASDQIRQMQMIYT